MKPNIEDRSFEQLLTECMNTASKVHAIVDKICRIHELTGQQWHLLQLLLRAPKEGYTVSQIGDLLHVTKGNVTGIVNRMEARSLVERVISMRDRRVVYVRITTAGEDTVSLIGRFINALQVQEVQEHADLLLPVFNEDNQAALDALWRTLDMLPATPRKREITRGAA